MDRFINTHIHTDAGSLLDGHGRIKDYVNRVVELDQPAAGINDHGHLSAALRFVQECRKVGVKPIVGIEAYVAPLSRFHKKAVYFGTPEQKSEEISHGAYSHMCLWALNDTGIRNLFRLHATSYADGYWYKPRIDLDCLEEFSDGLAASTGCAGSMASTFLRLGQNENAVAYIQKLREIFDDRLFVEVMSHNNPIDEVINPSLIEISKSLSIPLLATVDAHYVNPEDSHSHEAMLCLQTYSKFSDDKRFRFEGEGYCLKSRAEMELTGLPAEALDNTLLLADMVTGYDTAFSHEIRMPRFPVPDGLDASSFLVELIQDGRSRFDELTPEILAQEEYEIDTIISLGFQNYFLFLWDIINFAKSRDIPIRIGPGRGSAGGSQAAYQLFIHDLQPLEHRLLFERFLNPERVSLPDIDIDVIDSRRGEVVQHIADTYGEEFVAQLGTEGTIKAKKALQDSARVLGHYGMGERMKARLPKDISGFTATLDDPKANWKDLTPDESEVLDLARSLEGRVRERGVHAAGLVISPQPLRDIIPIHRLAPDKDTGLWITSYDMYDIEDYGLVKMDLLGLNTLGMIEDCLNNLTKKGVSVHLGTRLADLTDPETYALLSSGNTLGVFQFDSTGMQQLLRGVKPTEFSDIAAILALYRPGPMGVNAHHGYAKRKNGKEPVVYPHPDLVEPLSSVLEETYGYIVFQEQVLETLRIVGSYTYATAETIFYALRKKKPELLASAKPDFTSRMLGNGFSPECVEALWDVLIPFSAYCVSGGMVIDRASAGKHKNWIPSVENVYWRLNGKPGVTGDNCRYCGNPVPARKSNQGCADGRSCRACKSWRGKWTMLGGMQALGRIDDRVLPVQIIDVVKNADQELFRITLENGMTLEATADHKTLTNNGWLTTRELDHTLVAVKGPIETRVIKGKGYVPKRIKQEVQAVGCCEQCGETKGQLEVAHLDSDRSNNHRSNLKLLCNSCHKTLDYAFGSRKKRWSLGRPIEYSRVVGIESIGVHPTYDVVVDSNDHSWAANGGIITHNSFNRSHCAGYGVVSYWTAYLKAHYPKEWMAAVLSRTADENIPSYVADVSRLGIKILPPDINDSSGSWTDTDDGIRYGLESIKGIKENAFAAVAKKRPYKDLHDFYKRADRKALGGATLGALVRSGALDGLCPHRTDHALAYETLADRALSDRSAKNKGQLGLLAPKYEVVNSGATNTPLYQQWETELLGTVLTVEPVKLKTTRWLTESEFEYVATICHASPGRQLLTLKIGSATLPVGYVNWTEKLQREVAAVGGVVVE